jgi:glycosyltransferase involved in cell wall biosynthesis
VPPKITIITAVYNSSITLPQAIESVVGQDYPNYEYIIVDGGSTDDTVEVIRKYAALYPKNIRWVSEPDEGIYDALNKGIRMACGDVIGVIGGDDWYEPGIFGVIAGAFDREEMVICGLVNVYQNGVHLRTFGEHFNNLGQAPPAHQSCFVSKALFDGYGAFDQKYKIAADYDFFLRIYQKPGVKFLFLNKAVANFNSTGVSSNLAQRQGEFNRIRLAHHLISKKRYRRSRLKSGIKKILHILIREDNA